MAGSISDKGKYMKVNADLLRGIRRKLKKALPKDIYFPYDSWRLKFIPTEDRKEVNINMHIWRAGDEADVEYLSALQILEKKFPNNFKPVSKPKSPKDGIGGLIPNRIAMSVMEFHKVHIRIREIWLELDTLARLIYSNTIPYNSHAFCEYAPERGMITGRSATYNDLEHLRKAVKDGIQLINQLIRQLKLSDLSQNYVGTSSSETISITTNDEEDLPNIFQELPTGFRIRFAGGEFYYFHKLMGLKYIKECLRLRPKSIPVENLIKEKNGELPEIATHGTYDNEETALSIDSIKSRIALLQKKKERAKATGDLTSLEQIDAEFEQLEKEHRRLKGFKGHSKRDSDTIERYRSSVGRNITYAYKKLEPHLPDLVIHLQSHLSLGRDLEYKGDVQWRL
jgi:hypothetical protein